MIESFWKSRLGSGQRTNATATIALRLVDPLPRTSPQPRPMGEHRNDRHAPQIAPTAAIANFSSDASPFGHSVMLAQKLHLPGLAAWELGERGIIKTKPGLHRQNRSHGQPGRDIDREFDGRSPSILGVSRFHLLRIIIETYKPLDERTAVLP